MDNRIAIVIYNYIQYLNIMPGAEELIRRGYKVDFYGLVTDDKNGFQDIFDDVINHLKEKGYKVYTKGKKVKYKILLEPYESNLNINAKYNIRYRYAPISAKPDKVYLPHLFLKYDSVLCSGSYEARLLNNFTNTEIVDDLKYINFKKKDYKKDKKVLLYLPTYGEESSIELILSELEKLKNDYYIIAKIHHGTCFLKEEKSRIDLVNKVVDECFDTHKELKELLEISDVVLSDNSGSIFDAIYTGIPVAVVSNDINQNKKGDFNTTQYELYKAGVLPYTSEIKNIKKVLEEALSKEIIDKQKRWNEEYFVHSKDPIGDFVNIIDKYLNDDIDVQSYLLRKEVKKEFYDNVGRANELWNKLDAEYKTTSNLSKENNVLREENNLLKDKNSSLENELLYYRNGRLYKIANKIYKLKNGGK